jgi:hypothetical protein
MKGERLALPSVLIDPHPQRRGNPRFFIITADSGNILRLMPRAALQCLADDDLIDAALTVGVMPPGKMTGIAASRETGLNL